MKLTPTFFPKFLKRIMRFLMTFLYRARSIIDLDSNEKLQILNQSFKKQIVLGNTPYWLYYVQNGRIYTDRNSTIAVIDEHKALIRGASWQYVSGQCVEPSKNNAFNAIDKCPNNINGTVLSLLTGSGGNSNYFHWLFDAIPRMAIVKGILSLNEIDYFLVPSMHLPYQIESLKYLGILSKAISSEKFNHIKANKLLITDHPRPNLNISRWICDFLRYSFQRYADERMTPSAEYIYVTRQDAKGKRIITNEEDVIKELNRRGFCSVTLSNYTLSQQIAIFKKAKYIVSPHGAGLSNLVFSPEQTRVIEIFNESYRLKVYENLSNCLNLKYIQYVGKDSGKDRNDIYVNVANLISLL